LIFLGKLCTLILKSEALSSIADESFIDQMTYSTGSGFVPYAVTIADFNNDQRMNIAVANFGTNNIGVFLGTRNATFTLDPLAHDGSLRGISTTTHNSI
jgi:hypothetical protein